MFIKKCSPIHKLNDQSQYIFRFIKKGRKSFFLNTNLNLGISDALILLPCAFSATVWSVYMLNFAFQENQVRAWLLSVADSAQRAFTSHTAIFTCRVFIEILLLLYAETVVKVKIALKVRLAFHENLDILHKVATF